ATFQRCKLDLSEIDKHAWAVELHRDLLRLRRDDPTFSRQRPHGVDGAVLGPEVFVLRFFGEEPALDRLLLVNLGADLSGRSMAEPLLAPPLNMQWTIAWSSENPRYGGAGISPLNDDAWVLPGHAAIVLVSKPERHLEYGD